MFKKLPRNTRILEKELERKKNFQTSRKLGFLQVLGLNKWKRIKKEVIIKKYLRNL